MASRTRPAARPKPFAALAWRARRIYAKLNIGTIMTLTELKYIVAVARERHFGRAAEACFVSQPTLSVAIKKLEEELGVVIFERGGAEIGVTPIGLRIIEHAQKVLEEGANLREIARQGHDPLEGPLRVGVIYTVAPYLL